MSDQKKMIKENKYMGGFISKFGYDVYDNGNLIPFEKEQSITRLIKILWKKVIPIKSDLIFTFWTLILFKFLSQKKFA